MNDVIRNILGRRSVRAYKPAQISQEDLELILEAGRYAPSGMNAQSWRFTAIQNPAVLKQVNEAIRRTLLSLPVGPETTAYTISLIEKAAEENADFLYRAPTLVIVTNRSDSRHAMADSALALGSMMLAAHSLGIASCWLNQLATYTHMPPIRALLADLDVPPDHNVYGAAALGYAAEEPEPVPRKDGVIHVIS
ncbi:MAG: nitroreductase family protein [Clostridiales bacterium]|nr:nitroreductase family protein [Clostridiales bacterium]